MAQAVPFFFIIKKLLNLYTAYMKKKMKIEFNGEELYITFVSEDNNYVLVSKDKEGTLGKFKLNTSELVGVDISKFKKVKKGKR